ncbi:MAG: hypothetical protein HYY16_07340 [Planctomycetes bacterium]|nr:hypothetical protein [Planctomycetota bacterium]
MRMLLLTGCLTLLGASSGLAQDVSSPEDEFFAATYDVHDLLKGQPDHGEALVDLIRRNVSPESWPAGGSPTIEIRNGLLIVKQTRKVHAKLDAFLVQLRDKGAALVLFEVALVCDIDVAALEQEIGKGRLSGPAPDRPSALVMLAGADVINAIDKRGLPIEGVWRATTYNTQTVSIELVPQRYTLERLEEEWRVKSIAEGIEGQLRPILNPQGTQVTLEIHLQSRQGDWRSEKMDTSVVVPAGDTLLCLFREAGRKGLGALIRVSVAHVGK